MTPLGIGLIVTALVFGPLAIMVWLVIPAAKVYEDRDGFHLGEPDEHSDYDGDNA